MHPIGKLILVEMGAACLMALARVAVSLLRKRGR